MDRSFTSVPFAVDVLRELSDLAGSRVNEASMEELKSLFQSSGFPAIEEVLQLSVLIGLRTGLARQSTTFDAAITSPSLESLAANGTPGIERAIWALEKQLGQPASASQQAAMTRAVKTTANQKAAVEERIDAIQLLAMSNVSTAAKPLLVCLNGNEPLEIQLAALEVLSQTTDASIADGLLDQWRTIHPSLKRQVTLLMLSRRDYHDPLLTAIEGERIQVGELNLDLEDRRRLLRWSTADIHDRAQKLLGDGEYGNRQARVEEWLGKLPEAGNAGNGRQVFETACAQCHKVGELGFDVGPNLTGMSHRSVEDLVSNILDPNMAINPNYLSVSVESKDGELYTGIISAETGDAITLLQAQGIKTTLNRNDIKRFESTGTSLMPEGLEATMSPQQLRDLVAFLQE